MPWYFPWSESIKKRACRYLLQHYLGDFLKEKLTLDQLTVDIYNGKGTVTDVPLDVWALNEMLDSFGIPLELVDGFIGRISVAVPWTSLLSDSCQIEISGIELIFSPKQKAEPSMFDSTLSNWNSMSMTTSIQLAQECLKQGPSAGEEQAESSQTFEGLEAFAQTIESVLSRIRVSFVNTIVRMEHIPNEATSGVGVELHIDRIEFSDLSNDELGGDPHTQHSVYEPVAIAIKNFQIIGIRLFLDEFPEQKRTRLKEATGHNDEHSDGHHSLTPILNEGLAKIMTENQNSEPQILMPQVQILGSCGKQSIKVKLKQNDALPGPKVDIEYFFGAVNIFFTPRQIHLLIDVIENIPSASGSNNDVKENHKRNKMRTMEADDYQRVEQVLQQQLNAVDTNHLKGMSKGSSLQSALESLNSTRSSPENNRQASQDSDDDEFYSMGDYSSLPPLGQPPALNFSSHTGVMADHVNASASLGSERSSLTNVSLGGSSSILTAMSSPVKGSLTEKASSVFKPPSPPPSRADNSPSHSGPKVARNFSTPHSLASNGLAGISSLDDSSDLTHLRFRSSNIVFILLHQEPLDTPHSVQNSILRNSSEHTLVDLSEDYFKSIGRFSMQNLFGVNGKEARDDLLSLCPFDHIRVLMSAFTADCETRTISGSRSTLLDLVVGKLAADENLFDKNSKRTHPTLSVPYSQTKLLHFSLEEQISAHHGGFGATPSPCLKVKIQKTAKGKTTSVQSRTSLVPKSLMSFEFGKVTCDLDISIVDRITNLLWPGPLYQTLDTTTATNKLYRSFLSGGSMNRQAAFNQAIDDSPVLADIKTEIEARCSNLSLVLRFPIPDIRPASDIDKTPWWRQAIRGESLCLDLTSAEFKTTVGSVQLASSYEIRFKEGQGYFQLSEDETLQLFSVSCVSVDGDASMGLDWPRIVINQNPPLVRSVLEDAERERKNSLDSQFDSLEETYPWLKAEPSPFTSNPAMYEREELVMPGSVPEMNIFQELATITAGLSINCYLPDLQLNLHSRDIFELFYNRLFNDLLMWEPTAPAPMETNGRGYPQPHGSFHINLASQVGLPTNNKFFMCRSALRDGFDSDSDQDISLGSTVADHQTNSNEVFNANQQSTIAVALHVTKGSVAFFPPLQVSADLNSSDAEEIFEQQLGHAVIEFDNFHFFTVSGYKGDPNLDYLQLHASNATLYHSSHLDGEVDHRILQEALSAKPHMRTIYQSESSVLSRSKEASGVGTDGFASLSLAMKTTRSKQRKDNLIAVGLKGETLRYRVANSGESWLSQILDFMDVTDTPILGYIVPTVVTTLYFHLWSCSVDYRPKYLPIRSLLFIESFSISSNIIPGSAESLLRFIVEDSSFLLSDKQKDEIDLENDYVSVMDMESFELALRITDGKNPAKPRLELTMSNNILNIRTCSDSCAALVKLIKYFATDGDLGGTDETGSSPASEQGSEIGSVENLYSRSSVDEDEVDSLMADAMKETSRSEQEDEKPIGIFTDQHGFTSSELFSSSGPSNSRNYKFKGTPIVFNDEDDEDQGEDAYSSGDEYCILEPEKENQVIEDVEPSVRKLVTKEIKVIDNHFSAPLGRYDQMSAPSDFPPAVYRYTLREMSVVWQMYGGKDFESSNLCSSSPKQWSGKGDPKQVPGAGSPKQYEIPRMPVTSSPSKIPNNVRRHDQATPPKESFFKSGIQRLTGNTKVVKRDRRKKTLRCRGGPGRDTNTLMELEMNKIRFQHEIYPEDSNKISRDVLLIYDLEMRDRLSSSQINKFLYQFSSETLPKQSSANMVLVKFLQTKPEDALKTHEGSLKISLQPLRLNIDQDSLFFLKNFFTELTDEKPVKPPRYSQGFNRKRLSSSPGADGFFVSDVSFHDELSSSPAASTSNMSNRDLKPQDDPSQIFFRSVVFSPEVPIRLDYHGKHVDMDQGTFAGLLIGLAQLNCSELKLKRLCCRSGLLGPEKLLYYILNEWLTDIKRNQIHGILGGVGPTYSFVQLFQGIKDLFWLPVQQYKQDGRIVRGLQRGAHSFSTSTAMAILELTNRLVQTVQAAAETAYVMVSPGPSVLTKNKSATRSTQADQPADLREGVTNAYNVLAEGIAHTATTIMKVATEEHEKKGVTGAVGGVLRQIPPTVVQPFILATEATSNVLGGARNQLAPDARVEAKKKWKSSDE